MSVDCNLRFMDNQKIESGNVTVSNENSSFPLTNAYDEIRSKQFRTTTTETRITIDLGFPDNVKAFTLFAPLGESLGISKEATIKFQADNVNVWTSPEVDETITLASDDRLVYFTDVFYRFVSIHIDDPTNPNGYLNFAHIYLGDYTTTTFRNINRAFSWVTNDPSSIRKSLNGTAYYETLTKYDSFGGIQYALVTDSDRQILENLYERNGKTNMMPISIDPTGALTSGDYEKLTRLARFSGDFSRSHRVFEYFDISISLEEVI